jgi:thioredoxin reductase (NADPH)
VLKLKPFVITAGEETFESRAVIITTGADARWLNVKGESERIGKGVSSCATCDAFFFRNKDVIVVGGGDSAMEDASVLAKVANSVTLLHRRNEFRASNIMLERVKANPKIKLLLESEIEEIMGENKVEKVRIKNNKTGEVIEQPAHGVFVAIGHIPNTKVFTGIETDNEGYIKVQEHYHTNVEGVFTAGDVHDRNYRQAITASGFGCAAALETQHYLEMQPE